MLTQASFVAAKTAAWMDRSSPRDLYDLWALSVQDSIDDEALEIYKRLGPTGSRPSGWVFKTYPSEDEWNEYLQPQGRAVTQLPQPRAPTRTLASVCLAGHQQPLIVELDHVPVPTLDGAVGRSAADVSPDVLRCRRTQDPGGRLVG